MSVAVMALVSDRCEPIVNGGSFRRVLLADPGGRDREGLVALDDRAPESGQLVLVAHRGELLGQRRVRLQLGGLVLLGLCFRRPWSNRDPSPHHDGNEQPHAMRSHRAILCG